MMRKKCARCSTEVPVYCGACVIVLRDQVAEECAKNLRTIAREHVSLGAAHERACRERDTLVRMLASEFDWSDTSYLHAMMHVENAIRNLRAEARAAQAERDEATTKLVAVAKRLEENGCDCECNHCWEDHDEDCERCLACLIDETIQGKKEDGP